MIPKSFCKSLCIFFKGSINGGTVITLMGYGFSQTSTFVQIGYESNIPYYYFYSNDKHNTVITFNKITITTTPLDEGTYDVKAFTNGIQMQFLSSSSPNYTFSLASTPVLDTVSPINVSESSVITLFGNNFGNNTDLSCLTINIGDQKCDPISVNDTKIACHLNGLNLGNQNVKLNINGMFFKINSIFFQIKLINFLLK